MKQERGHFGSRIGVILATAGSAVGLGNIWRFPYMTGQDGGAAFILFYALCVILLGIPGMVAEFVVGRHSSANAAKAYRSLSGGGPWAVIGYMGVFTSMIILGFYAVVAGWCLHYLFVSVAVTSTRVVRAHRLFFSHSPKQLSPGRFHCSFHSSHPCRCNSGSAQGHRACL